jgi:HSP20 family protein
MCEPGDDAIMIVKRRKEATMTTVVKWAPFGDLDVVERRMRRMLEDFGMAPAQIPAADVVETEKELIVKLDAPGFDEKELALEVSDHTLTVTGERSEEKEQQDATFHLHERVENRFQRMFTLPREADVEHIGATFTSGVLEVHVPKLERAKPRTIQIDA